ncbi:MAG: T9SS type A sorting domain-containing protein, partial [Bacteroidales bacterium]|nr:T9SS type A sorting domain-containing protein [Bacteroidales bacterium]
SSGIRYAKATVNGVNGVILLPDNWSGSYYGLSNTNVSGASYGNNVITVSQWNTLELHGAVFLPAAGDRYGTSVGYVGSLGHYWSSSYKSSSRAWYVYFDDSNLGTGYDRSRYDGLSVRLVRSLQNYSVSVTAAPNPAEGGTVSGEGAYEEGADCTLTATPSADYHFVNWTGNGEVLSTEPSYTFTVTSDCDIMANFVAQDPYTNGQLNGLFSVAENAWVHFSQGNLQYIGSAETPYWKFAEHQWDYLGSNNQADSVQDSNRDLFGWATSGYDHGAVCYQPWSTSTTNSDYYAYGTASYNLNHLTRQADWGYNAISNGGNATDQWRTMTKDEWVYLFETRSTATGIRYAKAIVNGVKGAVLLPDDWSDTYHTFYYVNESGADFSTNIIDAAQWNSLEQHGAVFLPASGYRNGTSVEAGLSGYYWSASYRNADYAYGISFNSSTMYAGSNNYRSYGQAVRLVSNVENVSFGVNAIPNPAEGGTVNGAGSYEVGATCTLVATGNSEFVFLNWTDNGEVVSVDASYSFTVGSARNLVANFVPRGNDGSGALYGKFSVSTDSQVQFSQGNLQYIGSASTPYWKFAEHQWDYLDNNGQAHAFENANRDLFGWGTSGFNHGATCYQPWSTNSTNSNYYAYGNKSYHLFNQTGEADWGYNAISNGGNTTNAWRTLTQEEWKYVLSTRATSSGVRYAKAQVNSVNGVILLPDDWNSSYYQLRNTNTATAAFTSNVLDASQWNAVEQHGAIFLPAAGYRDGTLIKNGSTDGSYWSSSKNSDNDAYYISFTAGELGSNNYGGRYMGRSVRLVRAAQDLSYEINASPDPATGGEVTGAGTFAAGAVCTLTAAANNNYTFTGWMEDGEMISAGTTYSFIVTGNRTLVASFTDAIEPVENHWTPDGNDFEDNMTLTGVIQIDGVEQTSTMLEVGAFCGDQCRGSQRATYFSPTQRYVVQMTIFGEAGDEINFKLYDHEQDMVLTLSSPEPVNFSANGYGSLSSPYVLEFTSTVAITATSNPEGAGTIEGTGNYEFGATVTLSVTPNTGYQFLNWTRDGNVVSTSAAYQFVTNESAHYVANFQRAHSESLSSGWNWWSTYVELDGNSFTQLKNSIGSDGIIIKSRSDGFVEPYTSDGVTDWYGTLATICNEQMYKIRMNTAGEAVIIGEGTTPTEHPITINSGWNWIGYPSTSQASVEDALANFSPEPDDVIKGRNSYTTYFSGNGTSMWYGTLTTLEPGKGYMYQSHSGSQKTLTFQGSRGTAISQSSLGESRLFQYDGSEFADNMTVTAVVDLDGMEVRSEDYELAAYVGDECRGAVHLVYVEPIDRYVAFLTVLGTEGETLRFRLSDGTQTKLSAEEMSFVIDKNLGTLSVPTRLHFGATGVNESDGAAVNVYPNPSDGIVMVEGQGLRRLELVDMLGQTLRAETLMGNAAQVDLGNCSAGIYMLRIYTDNGIINKQWIKR